MCYFAEYYGELKYPIGSDNTRGLRNSQLGAIHAIASINTLRKKTAGIIVMPTGSGKTAVMMMTPYVINAKKALIVTPSIMVRGQIYKDFSKLDTLKKSNVFSEHILPPEIYELKHKYCDDIRESIDLADVVIATPKCALSLSESSIKESFDLILVDEAHHVPATTWQQILTNMRDSHQYLFTATPFRLDKKEIKGDLLYSYPLSMAYQDGVFGEVIYIPIEEAPDKDRLIAKEAERVFLNDRQQGYDHYIMVRTDTRKNAKQLELLYQKETALNLKRIDSSMSYRTVESTIEALREKRIDGIICVDMLGEGFDFPNLKIAAVHAPHKSLASTLQFIGRFARTNAENIGAAKFVAMNDEELTIANHKLFTSDAVWQDIIVDMNERTIRREEEVRRSLKNYVRADKTKVSDDAISLYSLRPNCHAKVYRVSEFNIEGTFPERCFVGDRIYRNYDENTIVGIGTTFSRPLWMETDQVLDVVNILYIVHYQEDKSLLFIYSGLKNETDYEAITEAFSTGFEKIPRNEIHRVLGELEEFEMFSTGMQSRYTENGEAYRIYAGSNVATSIDPTTGRMHSAGHVFCRALSANGNYLTIGYSSGSKIWSSSYVSLPEYVKWCNDLGTKISDNSLVVRTNTNYDFMPIPTRISEFPEGVCFAFFSHKTYSSSPSWVNSSGEVTNIILTDAAIRIDEVLRDKIKFTVIIEGIEDHLTFTPDGRYHCVDPKIRVKNGSAILTLVEYLDEYPLLFRTTDDSIIEGNEICTGNPAAVQFNYDDIHGIDWEEYDTDITLESGEPRDGKRSVQTVLQDLLSEESDGSYLIYDHGTGEIADFMKITDYEDAIKVVLYHVKAMSGKNYNSNMNDIYEVTQQAVKSLIWVRTRRTLLDKIVARRNSDRCELINGDFEGLKSTLKQDKLLTAKMIIVQPAISRSASMPDKYKEVLGAARSHIYTSGRFKEFEIWGSP